VNQLLGDCMKDIFISYVEQDKNFTAQLVRELEQVGYDVWYYERDSMPGQFYLSQVAEAIDNCKVFILIVSLNSLQSQQVTNELVRAYENKKSCIPLLFDVTHEKYYQLRPDWRQCLGATVSVQIPDEGIGAIIPRIVNGLKALHICQSSDYNNQGSPRNQNGSIKSKITLTLCDEGEDKKVLVFDTQNERRIIIGRGIECDVRVSCNTASRRHAMLLFDEEYGWSVSDLGSTGGTFMNSKRLMPMHAVPVKQNDQLIIGTACIIINTIVYDK